MPFCINPACGKEFERPNRSVRKTCSGSCAVAVAWLNPEKRALRVARLKAERATPEAKQRQSEINRKRWAEPGRRERLSEWNRQRWADPEIKASLSKSISRSFTHARREQLADLRRKEWRDPENRRRRMVGLRRVYDSLEWREKGRRLMQQRWQNPEWRKKAIQGMRRVSGSPENRRRVSEQTKTLWADPAWRAKRTAAIRVEAKTRKPPRKRTRKVPNMQPVAPARFYVAPVHRVMTSAINLPIRTCKCGARFRPENENQVRCIPCRHAHRA